MSETQSAGRPLLSNYECIHEPRPLTEAEVATGHEQDAEDDTVAYYAIKREDGLLGKEIGANTKTAKIRILYVTQDAAWSFTRIHKANEVENGNSRHAFAGDWPAVIQTDPETGQQTARRSLHDFRELAASLHDDAHELVTDGAGRQPSDDRSQQCPRCGITFDDAEHDICEDCQRVQRIVGDMPDDGLDEDDSNRGRLEVDN